MEIVSLVVLAWLLYLRAGVPPHNEHESGVCLAPPSARAVGLADMRLFIVAHKAVTTVGGGMEWWTRSCSCDRLAVVLVHAQEAEQLALEASVSGMPRPQKPKSPILYAYWGGGVPNQPETVTSMVVRTRDVGIWAALFAACAVASQTWPHRGDDGVSYDPQLVEGSSADLSMLEGAWCHWAPDELTDHGVEASQMRKFVTDLAEAGRTGQIPMGPPRTRQPAAQVPLERL